MNTEILNLAFGGWSKPPPITKMERLLMDNTLITTEGNARMERYKVKQIFSAMPYDLYITNYEEIHEYTTYLPHNISSKAAKDYLLRYEMTQQEIEEYTNAGVDIVDLFMRKTANENKTDDTLYNSILEIRKLRWEYHSIHIPKPKTRGKVKTRQKLINKLTHKKSLIQRELKQKQLNNLLYEHRMVPAHRRNLIEAMMRYSNVKYGKYIPKETIDRVVGKAVDLFSEFDYLEPSISRYNKSKYDDEHKRRPVDQFMIDAAKGRLDHLHILESGDLNDFMNGNGRFEKPHDKKHYRMRRGSRMNDDHILSLIKQELEM